MSLTGKRIGMGMTGSFCTFDKVLPQIQKMVDVGADVIPILSNVVSTADTRFMTRQQLFDALINITGKQPLTAITDVEPIGPKKLLDVMVVAPCTGNSLAKLANGITDTPVLMAVKSHLRNQRPVVIAISSNDILGNNARNLGAVLIMKNVFLVPFRQDDPVKKQNSVVADMDLIIPAIEAALENRQLEPLMLAPVI
ncbi:dipicolinate synthase subunit B [Mahella australiensis]|uniref:Dipicolinic acid synthetase, B subunit n=1 Tax=Mahella australiensis (strain DSM 15567 / CIP 107919 / 50-1 BON) TaxID=697281 RepID=F4A293_MAHA5|nr:dipicolinate synthase subunit B [Mahella australiensis]AEE96140.1 dipicolinic acid synthetase, B subunit [Mahella australiensis 50-1 BON]